MGGISRHLFAVSSLVVTDEEDEEEDDEGEDDGDDDDDHGDVPCVEAVLQKLQLFVVTETVAVFVIFVVVVEVVVVVRNAFFFITIGDGDRMRFFGRKGV